MRGADYVKTVSDTLLRAWSTQKGEIDRLTTAMAEAIKEKRNIFIFGCSHAGIIAEEVFYRTGGLAVINPIFFPALMLNTRPVTLTSQVERVSALARPILLENGVKKGDVLIIHSVSGRNNLPVEAALVGASLGAFTAAITSVEYSKAVTSRHESGKNLYEVCDLVLDNCGVPGDAAVELDGLPEKIGPTSTAVGAALINGIVIETVEKLIAGGVVPPVFMSANLDGGDEHNKKIFEEYGDNIFYV